MKQVILLLLFLFLLLPYTFLFLLQNNFLPVGIEFKVIHHTFIQAFISAVLSVLLGLIGACGLLSFRKLEFICLLPSVLPSLFVIIALLNLNVPYGLIGVVAAHTMINVGLVSFILAQAIKRSCGREIFLARLCGISKIKTFCTIVLAKIRTQIFYVFLTVFAFCISSFSIPLILSGGKLQVMELLIYELIRFDNNFSAAAWISIYQTIFILILVITLSRFNLEKNKTMGWDYISFKPFILLPTSITVLLFGSVVFNLAGAQIIDVFFNVDMLEALVGTISLSALTGILTMLVLGMILFVGENKFLDRIYLSFVAPSTAVIGISMVALSYWLNINFTSIALCLLFIGILYRLGWSDEISKHRRQKFLAKLTGQSDFLIFKNISWPLSKNVAGRLAGLASFWAAGDFAVCTILNEPTLGLVAKNLLSSYRIDGVGWIFLLMILVGSMMYFMFTYVTR